METTLDKKTTIPLIGSGTIISESELYKAIYRMLSLSQKWNRTMDEQYLRSNTVKKELLYHPFWITKTLVIAERPPFPPKKMPNMIFVDAVSGYRGVFSKVPPITESTVNETEIVPLRISDEYTARKYVQHVQHRQINRSYVLKKPIHEIKEMTICYLPIYKVQVKSELVDEVFYVNGNTGESEKYLSSRWADGKDLLI